MLNKQGALIEKGLSDQLVCSQAIWHQSDWRKLAGASLCPLAIKVVLFGSDTGLEGEVCRVTSRGVISLHIRSRSVCRQNFFVCKNGLTNEASKPWTGLELHKFVAPVHLNVSTTCLVSQWGHSWEPKTRWTPQRITGFCTIFKEHYSSFPSFILSVDGTSTAITLWSPPIYWILIFN